LTFVNGRNLFGLKRQSSIEGILILASIALIWSIEQFLVQGATLTPDMAIDEIRQFKREAVRFLINICFGVILVNTVPKRLLYVLFGLSCLMDSGLVAYHDYFHQPLSHFTLTAHANESVEVIGAFVDYFPTQTFLWLGAGLGVKVFLLVKVNRDHEGFLRVQRKISLTFGLIYLMTVLSLVLFIRPMGELKSWKSTSWFGGMYGYFITWVGESYYLGSNNSLLQYANSVANPGRSPFPSPITVLDFSKKNHVVVIQCESLSYWALDYLKEKGGYLMPFLNELRNKSVALRIEPIHMVGSSDADFCFLNSKLPNGKVTPYKIIGFDYSDALPFSMRELGYESHFFHGNRGTFFARRDPCHSMGFDHIWFQEELEVKGLPLSKWGIFDHDVFALSSSFLNKSDQPMFHFLISLTTHSPFNFLPSDYVLNAREDDSKLNRYISSMRYLDDCLKKYFSELPTGTWMILYGDHGPGFKKEDSGFSESVPFLVSRKNFLLKLSESQQSHVDLTRRQFDLLDMSTFFRNALQERLQ